MKKRVVGAALASLVIGAVVAMAGPASATGPTDLDRAYGNSGVYFDQRDTFTGASTATHDSQNRVVVARSGIVSSAFTLDVARYAADGQPDVTFGGDGLVEVSPAGLDTVQAVAVQSTGRVLVAFRDQLGNIEVLALTDAGAIDNTFGASGVTVVSWGPSASRDGSLLVLPDDRLVIASGRSILPPAPRMARLSANGTLDTTFGTAGLQDIALPMAATFQQLAIHGDGFVLRAETSSSGLLARLHADGTLDSGFAQNGIFSLVGSPVSALFADVVVEPDGNIDALVSIELFGVPVRISASGGGLASSMWAYPTGSKLGLDTDGHLFIASPTADRQLLTRLLPNLAVDPNFGDEVAPGIRAKFFKVTGEATDEAPLLVLSPVPGRVVVVSELHQTFQATVVARRIGLAQLITAPAGQADDPFGAVDVFQETLTGVRVAGWTIDPDTSGSIPVHVYVGATATVTTANQPRPDVGAVFPAYGSAHGFDTTVTLPAGTSRVCVAGVNEGDGQSRWLTCRDVTHQVLPFGSVDVFEQAPGGLHIAGWVIDPESASSTAVHTYVNGSGPTIAAASSARPDVAAVFPAYGANHGFDTIVPLVPGMNHVCVGGVKVGPGPSAWLTCRDVVRSSDPFGSLDVVATVTGGVRVAGWAIDPDSASPIQVRVAVDGGTPIDVTAGSSRADVGSVFPSYGPAHGFDTNVVVGSGSHQVCVTAVNIAAGADLAFPCRTV